MSLDQATEATARIHALCARVVEAPPDASTWIRLSTLLGRDLGPLDEEETAADHHATFGLHCPPYAGAFLDDPPLVGGPAGERRRSWAATDPDHLAVAFRALVACRGTQASHLRARVRNDLLEWAAPLVVALERGPAPWIGEVVGLGVEAAADGPAHEPSLPEPEDPLADPRAGLAEIARWTATPCRSGLLLTTTEVRGLARVSGLPESAGGRAAAFEALLRVAVDHRALGRLGAALDALGDTIDNRYAAWGDLGVPVAAWRARLGGARSVWARITEASGRP